MAANILDEVETFLRMHDIAPTALGARLGDKHLVRQLRHGRRCWPETERRIRAAMAEIASELPAAQDAAA